MPQTEKPKKLSNLIKLGKNQNKNLILLGTHHFKDILSLIRDYKENKLDEKKQQTYLTEESELKLNLPKLPANKLISIHQISEGCLGQCSFCKTRIAKGKLFSYPKQEILKSIESDLNNGAKEIWLTSQDNASYGLDKGKHELPELLKQILSLKHKFKLRLGMMDPNNVLPIIREMIEIYKDKKMFKFIHIPIQSASNSVLKDMNRFYKIEEAEKIIKEFRKEFSKGVIATDIIVGYPSETQEDHELNLEFIKKYSPDVLNLSKFSSHKQTPAGKLKILPTNLIRRRTKELMQLHRETAKQNKQQYLNKEIKVFVNKKVSEANNLYQARDENYNIVLIKCSKENFGKEIPLIIKQIGVHSMIGELTENNRIS